MGSCLKCLALQETVGAFEKYPADYKQNKMLCL